MLGDRRRLALAALTIAATIGLGILFSTRADEVRTALAIFPLPAFAACVLLHMVTLVARSEAWRLSLGAIGGDRLPRFNVHGANAGAFCCGALMSHCAMPARIALLRRLAGDRAPRMTQIAVADVPIFLLEICGAAILLALAGGLWTAPAAFALLGAGRLLHHRLPNSAAARGLNVLADRRLAAGLAGWVGLITLAGAVRVWLVLSLLQLPAGVGQISSTFASLGVFGLLPLGPTAPAAGAMASNGGADLSATLAAGLVIAASALLAVALYAALVLVARFLPTVSVARTASAPLGSPLSAAGQTA